MNTIKKSVIGTSFAAVVVLISACLANAHDGWIQSNVSRIFQGDVVYIDMQFGNHQNMHRDYKLYASKWDKNVSTFHLHTPQNNVIDLEEGVIDIGMDETKILGGGSVTYLDKNGYLVTSFPANEKGIYITDVRQDTVVSYAPERSIKCAKVIVGSIDPAKNIYGVPLSGFDKVLGQVLEIVPMNDPTNLAVGDTLTFQVLFKGEPLADAEVSVIPRGKTLPPMGEPNPNDMMADMDGMVSFTFTESNYHLIVVHVKTMESGTLNGKSYDFTKYTGDLTVIVRPAVAAPSNLRILSTGRRSVGIRWEDNSNNETGFEIERADSEEGPWTLIATTRPGAHIYIDKGLSSYTTYFYRARTVNSNGKSGYTNIVTATTR